MPKAARVLILEDSAEDAELVVRSLKQGGLEFEWKRVETEDDYLAHLKWPPDVVLADYNLPRASASGALHMLREQRLDVPFIVVSGAIGEEVAASLIKQGASDYLLKDRLARLVPAIRQALRERQLSEEKQRAEEKVRRSEAQLRAFVDNAPFGVCRISLMEDRFLDVNAALVRMLGHHSEEELLALSLSGDICADNSERKEVMEELKRSGHFTGVETIWKKKNGKQLTVLLSGRWVEDADHGAEIEAIVDDITEQRMLEDQLRESQKMEAVGRLAGGVAHDFNNLLGVIIGYSDLLARDLGPYHPLCRKAEEIERAGKQAAALTAQLLAFSRRQVLRPQVLDLNSIVSGMELMLRGLFSEEVRLRIELDPELKAVRVDPARIEQIILNLALNARDAVARDGEVTVRTRNVDLGETTVRDGSSLRAGRYVLLEVKDTGMGMDEETKLHIFEPFFSTKELGKGTGLGLATVYGTVRQSGGVIRVESGPGKGAAFQVFLPQVARPAEVARVPQAQKPIGHGSETVLLVEDAMMLRDFICGGLQGAGYHVMVAENGREALEMAEAHQGTIHLLLTDVIMPRLGGRELVQKLRGIRPGIPVLFMSGYAGDVLAERGLVDRQMAYIQKPFQLAELEQKVREVLDAANSGALPGHVA